jgi:hypothetical protein
MPDLFPTPNKTGAISRGPKKIKKDHPMMVLILKTCGKTEDPISKREPKIQKSKIPKVQNPRKITIQKIQNPKEQYPNPKDQP